MNTSKPQPLSDSELNAYEAQRDLGAELLRSIQEMKAGKGRVIYSEVIEASQKAAVTEELKPCEKSP